MECLRFEMGEAKFGKSGACRGAVGVIPPFQCFGLTLREASALRVVISWFRFFGLTLREVSLLEIASTLVESDG